MTSKATIERILEGTDAIFPRDTDFLCEVCLAEASDTVNADTLLFLTKRSDGSARELTLEARPYAIVCEEDDARRFPSERVIITDNVRRTLAIAYSNLYGVDYTKLRIVAVTGTNGKTTVSEMLHHILRESGADVGYIGTGVIRINETVISDPYYSMTTPDPRVLYSALRDMQLFGCTHVVMEVTSHAIALEKVAPIRFSYGIFTNLSPEHRDFHKDMESYFATKLSLFEKCERGLFNLDCRYSARAAGLAKCRVETVGVLRTGDVYATDIIDKDLGGSSFFYREEGLIFGVDLAPPGAFNVYNALMAIRCAIALGVKPCIVKRGINSLSSIEGRMEIIRDDVTVVIDYAHTPEAVRNTLNSLFSAKRVRQRLHLVIGCGGEREKNKRREIGKIVESLCDGIYLTEDNSRTEPLSDIIADILSGIKEPDGISIVYSRAEAIERAICEARSGDIIAILGKGREPYLIGPDGVREFSDRREAQRALRLRKAKNENNT